MTTLKRILLITALLTGILTNTYAGHSEGKFNASEFTLHHIGDSHEWHLWGEGEEASHIPLPVILVDGGLQMFSSDAFTQAHTVEVNGKPVEYLTTEDGKYAIVHDKIYAAEFGALNFDAEGHPSNNKPFDLSITKNVASMLLSATILLLLFIGAAKAYKKRGVDSAPKGLQSFMEPLVLFVKDEIAIPNIGEKKYMKFMPYLLTVFFFIWINNLMGLIPFFPFGANLSGNIAFTMTLAVCTLIITLAVSKKDYWKHIFMPPVPIALYPIMIPIELIGVISKPFSLMIRLFANITAGHIVILSFMCIIFMQKNVAWAGMSVPMALFISVLELLVAALQAFIFTMLSALFIGQAMEEHHEEAHH